MKCTSLTKFPNSNTYTACGQCMPCRINRRKEWMTKLLLEQKYYSDNVAFITLTYAPEYLPDGEYFKGGSLRKTDAQKFMKRFRHNYQYEYGETKIRYFMVGEYGSDTHRAHYHAILFGVDPHRAEKIVNKSWELGHTQCGPVKAGGIQYVCGYTLKKLTSEKDFPDGQEPEFSIKSTQPALGHVMIPAIAKKLLEKDIVPASNSWNTWLLEQEDILFKHFNGILGQKRHLRLDKVFMEKIIAYMMPNMKEGIEIMDNEHIIYPKEFKVRQSRLHHDSYLAKMQDIRSGNNEKNQKMAEKIFRRQDESKKI
jgi:hypothetical protein